MTHFIQFISHHRIYAATLKLICIRYYLIQLEMKIIMVTKKKPARKIDITHLYLH